MKKNKKTVLVVEDSPVSQELTKKMLGNDGYEVLMAWNGEDGLAIAKEKLPDAILMDVILPDIDGKLVAEKLRSTEATKNIPIIFTTNTLNPEKDKGNEVFKIGNETYRAFAKPLHIRKILSVLRKEINKRVHHNPTI